MKPRDALSGIFFGATLVILAVTGCAPPPGRGAVGRSLRTSRRRKLWSHRARASSRGRRRPVSKRRDPKLPLRARQRRLRSRRRHGSRRTAAGTARHLRSASAARRRHRNREQQSRQYRPHQLSRLAQRSRRASIRCMPTRPRCARPSRRCRTIRTISQRDQNLLTQGYISQQVGRRASDAGTQRPASAQYRQLQRFVGPRGRPSQRQHLGLRAAGVGGAAIAAQEKVAMAQAQQVRVQIAKAAIVSPIDGVVVNRNLNPGEYPGYASDLHAAAGQSDLCGAARIERSRSRASRNGTPATVDRFRSRQRAAL